METRYGYCKCGCGEKTTIANQSVTRHGYVKGEPRDYVVGHHNTANMNSLTEYIVNKDSGCWEWQLAKNQKGYGSLNPSRARKHGCEGILSAHRLYYTKYKGDIPKGLHIDHLCRNRFCVNPNHLEAVTPYVNTHRGINPKLTEDQVREARSIRESTGISYAKIATMFDMSEPTMTRVCKRISYRHVH